MPIIKDNATLPSKLFVAEQIKELEREAAKKLAIDMYQLMERAGHAVFESFIAHFPKAHSCLILAGAGNNGGDAFVVARLAQQSGIKVLLYASEQGLTLSGDALIAKQGFMSSGGDIYDLESLPSHVSKLNVDMVIDGLLGTGFCDSLRDTERAALQAVNSLQAGKLAIDIPSGLESDTGRADQDAFKADATVTFIGLKPGLFTADGPDLRGELVFADLEVGQVFERLGKSKISLLHKHSVGTIKKRKFNSHKGRFGSVLVLGGDVGMSGAAYLAGKAALRSGAGKVKVICAPGNANIIAQLSPELMVKSIDNTSASFRSELSEEVSRASIIIVGPGLGLSEWSRSVFNAFLEIDDIENKVVIVDADALNLIRDNVNNDSARIAQLNSNKYKPWVFTPHPLEAARLLDHNTLQINANRLASASQIAKQYGVCCVLKGCGTVVAHNDDFSINTSGNAGMATAGMGDVLTGVLAGAITNQFSDSSDIKKNVDYAVFLHGFAGDFTAKDGEIGMIATDVLESLPIAIKACQ